MPVRDQAVLFAVGVEAQADISTASASHIRFRKLNADIVTPKLTTENDGDEYGRGDEWPVEMYAVARDCSGHLSKFGSSEICTHIMAYALGDVAEASGVYTITPLIPQDTIQLPFFSIVQTCDEGGGTALDDLFLGNCINDFVFSFASGPGRMSTKMEANFVGSGRVTTPSGVEMPDLAPEHYMLSQSMSINCNGDDYVALTTILDGQWSWNNNLLGDAGYYPGAGLQDGFAVRGRYELGRRKTRFEFTARVTKDSTEYTKLKALTSGACTFTTTFDGSHNLTVNFPTVKYETVDYTQSDGILAVKVSVLPLRTAGDAAPVVTVTARCGVSGIAQ